MNMCKFKIFGSIFCIILLYGSLSFLSAEIKAFPVPWIPEDGKQKTGNLSDGITFTGLPVNGEIIIYTITGELVKRFEYNDNTSGQLQFFKESDNDYIPSGIYVWIVKSGELKQTGKLIILR